jgi:hypothetical protein
MTLKKRPVVLFERMRRLRPVWEARVLDPHPGGAQASLMDTAAEGAGPTQEARTNEGARTNGEGRRPERERMPEEAGTQEVSLEVGGYPTREMPQEVARYLSRNETC